MELTIVMSLENKLRKPTQGQMPAAVVDELAVQPPQEPENVADDHREQIINNLSDEDIIPCLNNTVFSVVNRKCKIQMYIKFNPTLYLVVLQIP
jgi:hypothetical protein